MTSTHIVLVVLGFLILIIGIIVLNALGRTIENLKVKVKEKEDKLFALQQAKNQVTLNKNDLQKDLDVLQGKYNTIRRHLKRLVDNPVSCLKLINKEGEDKFTTPALRLTAKGENVNYTAFVYQGGEDVTDRIVIALSAEETLEDVIESL